MPQPHTIALFGEAEKGEFEAAYYCHTLVELVNHLGNPPPNSLGLFYAVQALLYDYDLFFLRVREEGFSLHDYIRGSRLLHERRESIQLAAICVPGVGNSEIIEAIEPLCFYHRSLLIVNEADLYDYLTLTPK